jgi:hypothetical protein
MNVMVKTKDKSALLHGGILPVIEIHQLSQAAQEKGFRHFADRSPLPVSG